jgi:bifunctional N-acetylglucosamine-1-phosphate-uridyltransferase/glucosamine-1-phosphate-acetyltransferase GlmU-like protein
MARLAAILIDRKRDDQFRSATPRLLHLCAGQPLWRWVQDAVLNAGAQSVVLVGDSPSAAALKEHLPVAATFDEALRALGQASGYILAYADAPLLHPEDLANLASEGADAGGIRLPDLGEDGADMEAAFAFVPAAARKALTGGLGAGLLPKGAKADASQCQVDPYESTLRVIDRRDLSDAEAWLRARIIDGHQIEGVTFVDPATCYVDAGVRIGKDTVVHPHTSLTGTTEIGANCQIGPYTRLHDSKVGDRAWVIRSEVEGSTIRNAAQVGPWTRLRPGSDVGEGAHTGNFVELKKARLGKNAKAGHLSYLGDAEVGEDANIGAGTITANYDGKNKHASKIGKRAFIGSGTVLVAPVEVGDGALTGAGAVVLKGHNVPKNGVVAGVPAKPITKAKKAKKK